jgi:hypothetical protein
MKRICIIVSCMIVLATGAATAIPSFARAGAGITASNERWVGAWQGQLDAVPGVTITLSNDLGDLNGTIVFTALRGGSVAGHAVHLVMQPHVDGNVLSFKVKRPGSEGEILDISFVLTGNSTGQLRCPTCGVSTVEMEKLP